MKLRRRPRARHALESLPNVVGVGYGLKITDGRLTQQRCVTVFVDAKPAESKIPRRHRVPPTARLGGEELPTDVLKFGRLRKQGTYQIRAEEELGVAGCFGVRNGLSYAISCAHVVGGKNGIVNQKEQVEYWTGNAWQSIGMAYAGFECHGAGISGDWGLIDAGLVSCSQPPPLSPLASVDDLVPDVTLQALVGQAVSGSSYVSGPLNARVSHVFAQVGSPASRVDVVITRDDLGGLTYKGDSGLLWSLAGGTALALHVGGYRATGNGMTRHAIGFFVRRLERVFQLRLASG